MFSIDHLNPNQREAVTQTKGPLMILAGAGSGKTRTLVSRLVYLIQVEQVAPYRILAVTFSNKAAKEMRERVIKEIGIEGESMRITTFHSFCAQVLRKEAQYLGLSRSFTIYDDSESRAIIKAILNKRGINIREAPPQAVLYYIESLKNAGHYKGREVLGDQEIDLQDEFYPYFLEYESELNRSNALDFGGLITGVIELFEKHPDVLEFYSNRFNYLLVDEYQDTNRAQFDLVVMLAKNHRNICVVGDEDQSIYTWRGADIRNILDFEKSFSETQIIKLEQNYRSSKIIIEAATHLITHNELRKGKSMWTENAEGDEIQISECGDEKIEAEFLAKEIIKKRDQGVSLRDIAIFYRSNSQSRIIEDYLRRFNLPYHVFGGIRFYDRKEVKDLLSYLKVVINPKDSLSLTRIINVPARGIGTTGLRKLEQEAIRLQVSLFEIIEEIVNNYENYSGLRLSGKARSSLSELCHLINEVRVMSKSNARPSLCYEKILHESGYFSYLKGHRDYESLARIENLEELQSGITQFEQTTERATLEGFLESISLDHSMIENEQQNQDGEVALMTVHSAKGLEFPYVFLTGAEENLFPSYRSLEAGKTGLEEERRLFYVAMTRAMKKLYITFANGRMLFGSVKFNGPSRFIDELPAANYSWKKIKSKLSTWGQDGKNAIRDGIDYGDEFSQVASGADQDDCFYQHIEDKGTFPSGSKIEHGLYGKGIVVEVQGQGNDEKIIVKFRDGIRKKFLVRFAPITMVE